jgi:hypothetical protein
MRIEVFLYQHLIAQGIVPQLELKTNPNPVRWSSKVSPSTVVELLVHKRNGRELIVA